MSTASGGGGDSQDTMDYDSFLAQRQLLDEARRESVKALDEKVLWLGSGAIGLSLAYLGTGGASVQAGVLPFLLGGWGLLILAIGATTSSLFTSAGAYEEAIAAWDKEYESRRRSSGAEGPWAKATGRLTAAALVFLLLGLGSLMWAMWSTIRQGGHAMDSEKRKVVEQGPVSTPASLPRTREGEGVIERGLKPVPPPPPKKPGKKGS